MKRLLFFLALLALLSGCTFYRSGSQAIEADSDGFKVADGGGYDHGTPLDSR
jgi:hypothetical protein